MHELVYFIGGFCMAWGSYKSFYDITGFYVNWYLNVKEEFLDKVTIIKNDETFLIEYNDEKEIED